MPGTNRGQYCAYYTSYLSSGNLSRHLETCARFDGRFSVDRAKEALELEQKHKAKYTTKYVLSRSKVYDIVTTVPLAVGYGALNLWVRSLDR